MNTKGESLIDALYVSPFEYGKDGSLTDEMGEIKTVDDASTEPFKVDDVAELLYRGKTKDGWGGDEAVVILLKDGRYAAWETWWDATGAGFWCDAYGGDQDIWVGHNLKLLVLQALTDAGRELCGIPREGLSRAPLDPCRARATRFGKHVWTYPGRKWPFVGQPCACGKEKWA